MIHNDQYFQQLHYRIVQFLTKGSGKEDILKFLLQDMKGWFKPSKTFISLLEINEENKQLISIGNSLLGKVEQSKLDKNDKVSKLPKELKKHLSEERVITNFSQENPWGAFHYLAQELEVKSAWTIPIKSINNQLVAALILGFKEGYSPKISKLKIVKKYAHVMTITFGLFGEDTRDSNWNTEAATKDDLTLASLKQALKNEEFEVYYQPYYSLFTEDLGVEALIRWNHPKLGLLIPKNFLPLAEETGFITEMERWTLNKALSDVKKLSQRIKKDIHLSVNISAKQLKSKSFVPSIVNACKSHAFLPSYLTLEITERFNIEEEYINVLKNLRKYGVRISIDDFGKSFSSLHYLKQLPLDEIKIDREFISDLDTNERNRKIVEMIITLGHDLNLEIVAEGVERESQLKLLQKFKCDYVQGFLFAQPLPYYKLDKYLSVKI